MNLRAVLLSIAVLFLAIDLVQLTPLATPMGLADGLWGDEVRLTSEAMFSGLVPFLRTGAHLVGYTLVHFGAFALLGALSPWFVRATSFGMSLVAGVTFGTAACSGAFFTARWVTGATLVPDAVPLVTLLLANAMAGAVLGLSLHVGLADDDATV